MDNKQINERRRYKRLPIVLKMEVDELFKQDNIVVKNLGVSIRVYDISKSGIGFVSEAVLPVGYYFRGTINLNNGDFIRVVMRIVRTQKVEKIYMLMERNLWGLHLFWQIKLINMKRV